MNLKAQNISSIGEEVLRNFSNSYIQIISFFWGTFVWIVHLLVKYGASILDSNKSSFRPVLFCVCTNQDNYIYRNFKDFVLNVNNSGAFFWNTAGKLHEDTTHVKF